MVYHRDYHCNYLNYLFEQSMQERWMTCVTTIRKNIIPAINVRMEVRASAGISDTMAHYHNLLNCQ